MQPTRAQPVQAEQWEIAYREASLYLEEGEQNEKFSTHPEDPSVLPAYFASHNALFNWVQMAASISILMLAAFEPPGAPLFTLPTTVRSGGVGG